MCCLVGAHPVVLPEELYARRRTHCQQGKANYACPTLCRYAAAGLFTVQGLRYSAQHADVRVAVTLTGVLAALPCWFYSTSLHCTPTGQIEPFRTITFTFMAVVLGPVAVRLQSPLTGTLAVGSALLALGFSAAGNGFCIVIGFTDSYALERVVACSLLLVVVFSCLRVLRIDNACTRPFAHAAMSLGSFTYFLGMLVRVLYIVACIYAIRMIPRHLDLPSLQQPLPNIIVPSPNTQQRAISVPNRHVGPGDLTKTAPRAAPEPFYDWLASAPVNTRPYTCHGRVDLFFAVLLLRERIRLHRQKYRHGCVAIVGVVCGQDSPHDRDGVHRRRLLGPVPLDESHRDPWSLDWRLAIRGRVWDVYPPVLGIHVPPYPSGVSRCHV